MARKKHAGVQKKPIEGSFWRTMGYANASDIVTTVSQPIALQTIMVRGSKPMRRARMLERLLAIGRLDICKRDAVRWRPENGGSRDL